MIDPDEIDEGIGGVQGDEGDTDDVQRVESDVDTSIDVQAPDAGEIEWAGGLIKKAPGIDEG